MPENLNLYQMGNSVSHRHRSGTYSLLQQRMAPVHLNRQHEYVKVTSNIHIF
jgi:hypothetical protein